VVVQQPRQERLPRPGPAADLVGGFQDRDLHTRLGQSSGGGEPIGPAAHHDPGAHAVVLTLAVRPVDSPD
jgi:hypothetical protein